VILNGLYNLRYKLNNGLLGGMFSYKPLTLDSTANYVVLFGVCYILPGFRPMLEGHVVQRLNA
jgi:hypothetical protein